LRISHSPSINAENLIPFLAEACFRSRDYEGANGYLEQMPDIDRIEPEVIDLEPRLIPKTGEWEKARRFSNVMEFAVHDQHRITAAEFRVEWAAYWMERGKEEPRHGTASAGVEALATYSAADY